MRLIDADALMEYADREFKNQKIDLFELGTLVYHLNMGVSPTVDAVQVVRCGECSHSEVCKMDDGDVRYCHIFEMQTEDDYYCADGESLEEDDLPTSANHDGERKNDESEN